MSSFEIYGIVGLAVVLLCCGVAYTLLEFWRGEETRRRVPAKARRLADERRGAKRPLVRWRERLPRESSV